MAPQMRKCWKVEVVAVKDRNQKAQEVVEEPISSEQLTLAVEEAHRH